MKSIHEWRVNRLFREMGTAMAPQPTTPPQPGMAPMAGTNQPTQSPVANPPQPVSPPAQNQPDSDADMKDFVQKVGSGYRRQAKMLMDSLSSQSQGTLTPKKQALVIALMLHGMGVNEPGELTPVFKLVKQYAQEGLLGQDAVPEQQNQR